MTIQLSDQLRVSWRERGDKEAPALVLLHAFPLSGAMWERQSERFAPRFRVLAPDARGFGDTSPFLEAPSIEQLARDVAQWLDALNIETAIVGGCSMGGYTALEFARLFPDRLRGLVLCDTRADADAPEAKPARDEMIAFARVYDGLAIARRMMPRLLCKKTLANQPAIAERVRDLARPLSGENAARMIAALRDRRDSTPILPSIRVSTLVIGGAQDLLSPPEIMAHMAAQIPHACHILLENAGHLSPLEQPEAWNDALENWLAETFSQ